ncbi:sensor histidine kinase [Nocardioides solisilvae]|uniref:sensor histidine kinase n=1 Tax=Nocardioides solisilvae TaxID=1542435 RepID=UPI0013A54DEA|nr:sensor domain-containing protein [Nocardioides solisilvae]
MPRPLAQPPRLGEPGAVTTRLEVWGLSLGYTLLAVPVLALSCLMATALSVAVVGVGLALLLLLVPLNQALAGVHRKLSGRMLGREIETPYLPVDEAGSWWGTLGAWSRDPARWRDFAWTFCTITAGWTLSWIALGLGLAIGWYALYPLLHALVPDGVLDVEYGVFTVDTQAEAFLEWALLLVVVPLWWFGTPLLMRWRAQLDRALLAPSRSTLEQRVAKVTESRAETIDRSASEIRRTERDLHDGAQARLVSLGMSLGLAEQMLRDDPERAMALITEARATATTALGDLRSVVRGIHPPVLADRGLGGAVQALALDLAVPVAVLVDLPGRPRPGRVGGVLRGRRVPGQRGQARRGDPATVELTHEDGALRIMVGDDGIGGADAPLGSGLAGTERRLAAFDGTMVVRSPVGGPTTIVMEVPCALSSPRTTPSSGTA